MTTVYVSAPDFYGQGSQTISFQQAALSGAETIIVPAGTYTIGQINLSVPNQQWVIEAGANITLAPGTSAPMFNITANGVSVSGSGTLDGNYLNQARLNAYGIIHALDCNGLLVDGLTLQNSAGLGVFAIGCNKVAIKNNIITTCDQNAILVQPDTTSVTDVIITGNRVDRTANGAGLTEGGIKVHGNPTSSYTVAGIVVANNRVYLPTSPTSASAVCIEIWGGVSQATLTGNRTSGGSMGISANRTTGAAITGNFHYNASLYGIEVPSSAACTVTGNTIDGNGLTTIGIILDGSAFTTNCSITGNTVRNTVTYGIQTVVGSAFDITGNSISHTAGYGIYMQRSFNFAISGNMILGGTQAAGANSGVMCERSYQGSITGNFIDGYNNAIEFNNNNSLTLTIANILVANNNISQNNIHTIAYNSSNGGVIDNTTLWITNNGAVAGDYVEVTAKSADYTLINTDAILNVTTAASTITITLPANPIIGQRHTIRKADSGAGAVAFSGTVEGGTPSNLASQYAKLKIEWSGAVWFNQ